jgi:uncharacterized protein Smg (DUF494 family)
MGAEVEKPDPDLIALLRETYLKDSKRNELEVSRFRDRAEKKGYDSTSIASTLKYLKKIGVVTSSERIWRPDHDVYSPDTREFIILDLEKLEETLRLESPSS